jgi:hypothetical protein
MTDRIKIGSREYLKNPKEVFEIPLLELLDLRFAEVPYYSTVEISGLPGAADSYSLAISATNAGGPHNEQFALNFHVNFNVVSYSQSQEAVNTCSRRRGRVRRYFSDLAVQLQLTTGPDVFPFFDLGDSLHSIVGFSREFKREENPILRDVIQPFVTRFTEFLKTRDTLLFLCHASEDKPFVERLCTFLNMEAVSVWYDRREIKVGDSIVSRISDGLGSASHLVVVLSRSSVAKPWVLKEMSAALMRQLQNKEVAVLPLLVEQCSIPPILSDIKFADCREQPERGFQELLAALE